MGLYHMQYNLTIRRTGGKQTATSNTSDYIWTSLWLICCHMVTHFLTGEHVLKDAQTVHKI